MRTTLLAMVLTGMLIPGCVPPAERRAATDGEAHRAAKADNPYSVESMTAAMMHIESVLGTDRIRPLRARYEEAFRADPKHPFKRFLWAYSLDDRNRAWGELTKITKLNDRFYWAYLGMAVILDGWKVYDQATSNFQRALELGPRIAIGHGRFGRMYLHKQDSAEALPLLERAVELDPGQVAYRLDLARALDQAGRLDRARVAYQKVLEQDPKNFTAARELADLIRRTGDKQAAVEAYTRAAALDEGSYSVRFTRAGLLAELDRTQEALDAYQKACGLDPDALDCWQALAKLAATAGRQEIRLEALEKVVGLDPDNLEAHKFLGPVYLEQGAIEKALPSFRVVLAKEKDNLQVLAGMATIYEQGGEYSRAIEFNERVVALQPDHAAARAALQRLFERFHVLQERISGDKPDDVFTANRVQIAKVYKELLEKKPELAGELHLKVTVNNQGGVEDVTMVKNTVGEQVIDLCAYWNLRRSEFPPGFGATYDFELTLKPGG